MMVCGIGVLGQEAKRRNELGQYDMGFHVTLQRIV